MIGRLRPYLFTATLLTCLTSTGWAQVTYRGTVIPEEELTDTATAQVLDGVYIAPNEFANHLPALDRIPPGALISVGTFRALNLVAFGNFSELIMLDLSPAVGKFNRYNLELIRESSTREDYLSKLFRLKHESIVFLHDKNKVTLQRTPEIAKRINDGDPDSRTIEFAGAIRETLSTLTDGWNNISSFYFTSDELYSKVRKMVLANQVTVIVGSLSGEQTMPSLARAFHDHQVRVALFDISNVPDYLHDESGTWFRFLDNVSAFPFDEESRVALTTASFRALTTRSLRSLPHLAHSYRDSWSYLSFPATLCREHRLPKSKFFSTLGKAEVQYLQEASGWGKITSFGRCDPHLKK